MNLYFRFLFLLLWQIPRNKVRLSLLDTSKYSFRVLPLDCDINLHLTNSRYLALMDLARTLMMSDCGLFGKLAKRKWLPIVSSTEITFIKDIKPWQQCEIHSKMVGWDHKYFYIEQRFVCGSTVHAIANLRGLFVHKRKVIDIDELIALTGEDISSPPLPETIIHWKALLEAKKSPTS